MLNRDVAGLDDPYVWDAWYVAAWSDELTDAPLPITLLEEPVVLYRRLDGSVAALEDRCIHRSLPLSVGRVRGDSIECGYHGLHFDATGRCVRIPGQERIPTGARIRSYPVVERDRCIWVWTGDPLLADPTRITPFPTLAAPDWQHTKLHAKIECHYKLIIDNLLDLSHLSFVHGTTVGSLELADRAKVTTERTDSGVRVSRWTLDVPPAPTYAQIGRFDGNVDRWQISEFQAPGTFVIRNGAATAGTGAPQGKAGEQRWEFIVCHGITPETRRTTNYFWAVTHGFGANDPEGTAEFHRQSHQVIGEDLAVFTAQQQLLERLPDARVVDIHYDAGPNRARRLLQDLAATEAARRASRTTAATREHQETSV